MYDNVQQLPSIGFLRISQILGCNKSTPPKAALFPVSKSTWWAGVKTGRFPAPIKLSQGITVWRVEDIRSLIDGAYTPNQEEL